jgi:hypothetical protein
MRCTSVSLWRSPFFFFCKTQRDLQDISLLFQCWLEGEWSAAGRRHKGIRYHPHHANEIQHPVSRIRHFPQSSVQGYPVRCLHGTHALHRALAHRRVRVRPQGGAGPWRHRLPRRHACPLQAWGHPGRRHDRRYRRARLDQEGNQDGRDNGGCWMGRVD